MASQVNLAHIGSYHRNLGDNVAIKNVRNQLEKKIKNINWISIDIDTFWRRSNNPQFTIDYINKKAVDGVIVGGGGLIEYKGYEHHETNYKLPFNKHILQSINCPVCFVGVGINYFRKMEGFSDVAKNSLKETIDESAYFSLRNDGSINKLKELGIYTSKIKEIPDPGLIFDYERHENLKLHDNYIQPSFNSNERINIERFKSIQNLQKLIFFSSENNLRTVPHTPKDYRHFYNYVISSSEIMSKLNFDNTENLVKMYLQFDSVVAMRGHGQLISIGLNVPSLYFSTQDKVRDFSILNGFSDYNIDITEKEWFELLCSKFNLLLNDREYLQNWYSIRGQKIKNFKQIFNSAMIECSNSILQ